MAVSEKPTLDDLHKLLLSLQERIDSLEWHISQRETLRKGKVAKTTHKSAIDDLVEKSRQGMQWQQQLYRSIKQSDRRQFFD